MTTSINESAPLTKVDQAAWEAPALRPVFTPAGEREQWAHPCPDWCKNDDDTHDPEAIIRGARSHVGESLRVRQDGARGFSGYNANDEDGMYAAHLELCLEAGSRSPESARIRMTAFWGDGRDGQKRFQLAGMYPDEVRELICALQHLLKVAQV